MSDSQRMSEQDEQQFQSDSSSMMEEYQNANNMQPQEKIIIQREQNDHRCATYIFTNEDHTLGNMLRVVLNGHAEVEFVGYSIPHPSDNKLNLRLQTVTQDSNQVLDQGLKTIQAITKTIRAKFGQSIKSYKKKK